MSPRHALTEDDSLIDADHARRGGGWMYRCSHCDGDMCVVGGPETGVRKHFRHRPDETCIEYAHVDETKVHYEGKNTLANTLERAEWATNVEIEVRLGAGRPDILFETDDGRIGVELQVSPISAQAVRERTRQRSSQGLYTLWLFHDDTYSLKTSKSGNQYIVYRQGEYGYLSLFSGPSMPTINYFSSTDNQVGQVRGIDPFDDGDGGFIDWTQRINSLKTFMSTNGFRLATVPRAVPNNVADEQQARLF